MAVTTLTDENFEETIQAAGGSLVKFYADWCGSCKLFAPKFKRMSEANQSVAFYEVNAEHNPIARKLAAVDNLPFVAAFKGGQLVEKAATSKEEFVNEMIAKVS